MTRPSDAAPALRHMRRQLRQISGEMTRLLSELENAEDPPADHAYADLGRMEAIVKVLDTEAVPMAPVAIWSALRAAGFQDEKNLVQVTTYQLWRRGRLVKLGRGIYCHPDHVPAGARPEPPTAPAPPRRRKR